jgi:hypothetical protein
MSDFEQDPQGMTEYECWDLDQLANRLIARAADPDQRQHVQSEFASLVETTMKLNGLVAYLRQQERDAAA